MALILLAPRAPNHTRSRELPRHHVIMTKINKQIERLKTFVHHSKNNLCKTMNKLWKPKGDSRNRRKN